MQNTIENKLKFFNQYFGQRVLKDTLVLELGICDGFYLSSSLYHLDNYHLELRSIDSITNDECVEVYDLLFDFTSAETHVFAKVCKIKFLIENEDYSQILTDFLRSKGFLVPFMNLTTDQILEFGWAKIKENEK